jgi:signal transduction histidine kinase
MRRVRLGTILTTLVLVATLPLAALALWLTSTSGAQQQALIDVQNIEKVRAVSTAIDLEIERTTGALVALTTLDPIDAADLTHFTRLATRMLPLHPAWTGVSLIDPSLRVVANTGPTGPTVADPDWVQRIFTTGIQGLSAVRRDASGQWIVNAGVPVKRGGEVRYVLAAQLRAAALGEFLRRQQPPDGGVLTLLDGNQTIMARTRNDDRYVGFRPTADFIERSRRAESGSWRTVLLEGTPAYSAWYRSPLTGWTVGLGVPSAIVDRPLKRRMQTLLAIGTATVGLGVLVALVLGRSIVRAQIAAAASARALARGEPVPIVHSYIADADDLGVALHDAAAILEQRLRERDAAANALNRAKDNLVATVSHELRTPLNAIYGWVALLRTGSLDPERQAHALDVIERNARAQSQVVEDLLDMSTIVQDRLRLEQRPVDLAMVVRAAVDMVAPEAASRRTRLAVHTGDAPIVVIGDPARIQQIVWNLVANAMKFTAADGHIDVTIAARENQAVVTVSDDGEGIAAEFLPYVFDRFRQETENATRQHSGLGIGLALARTLTELHGGTISAQSDGKGAGASFTVCLPLRRSPSETGAPDRPAAPTPGPK